MDAHGQPPARADPARTEFELNSQSSARFSAVSNLFFALAGFELVKY
jgi:hypothetical protein